MLAFRLMSDNDIPLLNDWLNKEHVKRWCEIPHLGVTIDDWMHEFREHNGEFRWITHLIAMYNNVPIGLCQYYRCEDSKDEDFGTLPIQGSYGIDYLIGEESYLRKGLGKEIIALLVDRIFSLADAERNTAEIDKNNKASGNALLSCGFTLFDAERSRYLLQKQSY